MRRKRSGFTLIEVAFFIAITGLLFVGILVGTQNSVWQQRYNDAVQSFAGFLRGVYAEVSSVQGLNSGRSDKAIYGKMISFGQKVDLEGEPIKDDQQRVFVYDVIGNATGGGENGIKAALASLEVNVLMDVGEGKAGYAGIAQGYTPIWGSVIEGTDLRSLYTGTILVVRSPNTGLINTLVSTKTIDVNYMLANNKNSYDNVKGLLTSVLSIEDGKEGEFKVQEVDFCLNPYGSGQAGTLRRDIRLIKNARNASGVEVIDLVNDARNACAK